MVERYLDITLSYYQYALLHANGIDGSLLNMLTPMCMCIVMHIT